MPGHKRHPQDHSVKVCSVLRLRAFWAPLSSTKGPVVNSKIMPSAVDIEFYFYLKCLSLIFLCVSDWCAWERERETISAHVPWCSYGGQRTTLWRSVGFPCFLHVYFIWDLWSKLKLSDLGGKHCYPLSHLTSLALTFKDSLWRSRVTCSAWKWYWLLGVLRDLPLNPFLRRMVEMFLESTLISFCLQRSGDSYSLRVEPLQG